MAIMAAGGRIAVLSPSGVVLVYYASFYMRRRWMDQIWRKTAQNAPQLPWNITLKIMIECCQAFDDYRIRLLNVTDEQQPLGRHDYRFTKMHGSKPRRAQRCDLIPRSSLDCLRSRRA